MEQPIANPTTPDELFTLKYFEHLLEQYQTTLSQVSKCAELKDLITDNFITRVDSFIATGNQKIDAAYETASQEELTERYNTHFILPKRFKALVILHRDSLVQLTRIALFRYTGRLSITQEENFFKETYEALSLAINDFEKHIETERQALRSRKDTDKFIRREYNLKTNPWAIYTEQLQTLKIQILEIQGNEEKLLDTQRYFDAVKEAFQDLSVKNKELVAHYEGLVEEALEDLIKEDTQHLASVMERRVMAAAAIGNQLPDMSLVEEIDIPHKVIESVVSSENGMLKKRSLSLKKDLRKWLDYRIMPRWTELQTLEETFKVRAQVRLTSIANGLQVSQEKITDLSIEEIIDYVKQFKKEVDEFEVESKTHLDKLTSLLYSGLDLIPFVQGKPFLEVPIQSSFEQTQRTALNTLSSNLKSGLRNLNRFYAKVRRKDDRNNYELALEAIRQRYSGIESGTYDALFRNRRFMGDLFLVERQIPLKVLTKAYEDWKEGFPRACLVTGVALSGKSTFIQDSGTSLFGRNVVKLQPDASAVIEGRKFNTTRNLEEALSYIKKHHLRSAKLVLIIDDLEFWRDANVSLVSNVRALLRFIENENDEFFVVVGCNQMMVENLNGLLPLKSAFTTHLNLSEATTEEIKKAVLVRHQSAHKVILDKRGNEFGPKKVQNLIERLAKDNQYNLGKVLQAWSYTTIEADRESLRLQEVNDVVDFFTPEERILLKQVLLFKTVTDKGLRRVTGSGFQVSYHPALKRLLNSRVLMRDLKGSLYIPAFLVNDIEMIINKKTTKLHANR
ncbi:MAG: hypothetical protein AAF740_09360 [Bacteroidota bacterium]